ncbi:MAG: TonB-dependent receptor [Alphaproteobacteria bacterium]|nr:TonB-dependent receptor [Alphaproteobacteria bacterium]
MFTLLSKGRLRHVARSSTAICTVLPIVALYPHSGVLAQNEVVEVVSVDAQQVEINISADKLKHAIIQLSTQAGIQVIYDSALNLDIPCQKVRGTLSAVGALTRLLQGTGLTFYQENAKIFRLQNIPGPKDEADPESVAYLEEVQVTGSRITHTGFDADRPVTVLNDNFINLRGFKTAAAPISQLPTFFAGEDKFAAAAPSTTTLGQSFPNAYGLGTQRTLVLVNGSRLVSQNSVSQFSSQSYSFRGLGVQTQEVSINNTNPGDQVDLNTISPALIDRLEVIYTGGTPAYGSGAIAGTVNVILKDDFEGSEVTAQYGISGEGDAQSVRFQNTWGQNFASGRGNIAVSVDYGKENGLYISGRPEILQGYIRCLSEDRQLDACKDALTDITIPHTGVITRNDALIRADLSNGLLDSDGNLLILDFDGGLIARTETGIDEDNISRRITQLATGAKAGENPYYPYLILDEPTELITPQERIITQTVGHYGLSDNVRFVFEGSYVNTKSKGDNRGFSYASSRDVAGSISGGVYQQPSFRINAQDNPYVSEEVRQSLIDNGWFDPASEDPQYFFVARSNADILGGRGRGRNRRHQEIYRGVVGFEGEGELLGRVVNWDVSANYGETRAKLYEEDINQTRLRLAADAVVDPDSGAVVCRASLVPDDVGADDPFPDPEAAGCVPVNILGFNQFDPAVRDYLLQENVSRSRQRQLVLEANLETSLFALPAGDVGVALGYHFRREGSLFEPVRQNFVNLGLGANLNPISGHLTSNELYGELSIPLVHDGQGLGAQRFIENWTLEAASRYVQHSASGGDVSFTIGSRLNLRLPLIDDALTLRGHYSEAIRTPALSELIAPELPTSSRINRSAEPCYFGGFPDPVFETNCSAEVERLKANGTLPEDFDVALYFPPDPSSLPGSIRGNPNLENETTRAWTVGAVFAPKFIKGLTLALDWTKIRFDQIIRSEYDAAVCYGSVDLSHEACLRAERNPETFELLSASRSYYALSPEYNKFQAWSLSAEYTLDDFLGGQFTMNGTYFYIADTPIDTGDLSKSRSNVNLIYQRGYLTGLLEWQRFGGYRCTGGGCGPAEYSSMPSVNLFNASLRYELSSAMSLQLVVNDVFDNRGDALGVQLQGTIRNPVGRSFLGSITARF